MAAKKSARKPAARKTAFEDDARRREPEGSAAIPRGTNAPLSTGETEREYQYRFHALFDQTHDAVFILDLEGRHVDANQRAAQMLGYTLEELKKLSYKETSAELEESRQIIQRLLRGEQFPVYERRFRKKSGEILPTEINVELVRDEAGNPAHIQSVVRDITERKRAEEAHRESEERFRALFENSPVAIWDEDFSRVRAYLEELKEQGIADLDAYLDAHEEAIAECIRLVEVRDVNQAALRLYEAESKSELLGGLRKTFPKESFRKFKNELLAIARGGLTYQTESAVQTFRGNIRNVLIDWLVMPGHERDYSKALVSLSDVTQIKLADAELKQSHSLLNATLESTADGILVVDLEGKVSGYNRKFLDLWGIPDDLAKQKNDQALLDYVLNQLKEPAAFLAKVNDLYHSPAAESSDEIEFLDGRVIERYSQPQRSGDAVLGRVWSFRDITERKRAGEAVANSEKRLRALVENGSDEISLLGADGVLLYESLSANPTLGYAPNQFLGQDIFQLVHPDDLERVRGMFEQLLQVPRWRLRDQFRLRHKSGAWLWVEAVGANLLDEPAVGAIVVNYHNITDRKQAEDALRASEEKIQNIIRHSSSLFYTHTTDHVLVYVSPQSRTFLDCKPEEAMAHWQDFLSDNPANQQGIEATRRAIQTGERQPAYELELVTRKNRKIWVEVDESPVLRDGKTIAIVGSLTDITARKQAAEKLRASENRYRLATKATNDVIWEWNLSTDELFWSDNIQVVFGYAPAEVGRHDEWWRERIHPEDRERVLDGLDKLIETGGTIWEEEYRFLCRDGSYVVVSDRGYAERGAYETPLRMIGAMSDVTERKKSEEQIKRRVVELEALYQSGIAFNQTLDPKEIGEKVIEVLVGRLEWRHVAVRVRRGESREVELLAFSHMNEEGAGAHLQSAITDVGQGMAGWVIENGQPVRTTNLEADPRYKATYGGMKSGLYVPIRIQNATIGCISAESEFENAFSPEDERLLTTIALQAGAALESARLYRNAVLMGQRLAALYEAGQQMVRVTENTEELYAAVHRAAMQLMTAEVFTIVLYHEDRGELESVYLFDRGGRWYAPPMPLGDGFSSQVIASGRTILNNDLLKTPLPAVHFGTEEQVRSVLAAPLRSGDKIVGAISTQSYSPGAYKEVDRFLLELLAAEAAIAFENARLFRSLARELDERGRAEAEIQRRAEEFSALYEAARSLAGETDLLKVLQAILDQAVSLLGAANGTISLYDDDHDELALAASKNFPAQLGERRKMGQGMAGIVAQTRQPLIVDDYNSWERRHPKLAGAGLGAAIEVPLIYHDSLIGTLGVGETDSGRKFTETDARLLSLIGAYAAGAVENARLFQFLQNELTERRQAQQALAASEERYRSLIDQLPAMVYLDDLQVSPPTTRYMSPRVRDILGYTPEEWLAGGFDLWVQSLHPDDRERAVRVYQESIASGQDYSQDYRMITCDGRTVWLHDSAVIQRDENGAPIAMQGVVYDITSAKNAESALRLLGAALENADNAIVITDARGTIQWINSAYTRLTGYEAAEAIGKNPRILYSGMQDGEFYKSLWDTITGGAVWRGELVNRRKDGSHYYEEESITPLLDPGGRVTHFIGIKQDITGRKQTEERILRQLTHIAALREIDQAIASSFDMRFSLNVILSKSVELLEADAATALLYKPVTGAFEYAAGLGFRSRAAEVSIIEVSESHARQAVTTRKPVRIPNLADEPGNKFLTGFLKDEDFASYYNMPLLVKGQALGVLEIFSRSPAPRDEEWFDYLEALAGQAAIAVDNAQLFSASQRELAERKLAEERLSALNVELEKRIEERTGDLRQVNFELERALRVKDEFLASMSHELRTPLNAIIGLSESLAEQTVGGLNERQAKYVGVISESGQHLLELINDILDLAKIEAGQAALSRDKVDISQACQSSLRMIKQLASKKSQEVRFEMEANLGMIWADDRRLKQMLVNLLGNAVKFTPEKGKIGLRVRGDHKNNAIRFTVWDTGIGIHENDLPQLFKPFVQLDSNLARRLGGTGLGLTLVAKMASLHGGSVSVESQLGVGSHFTVTLPWQPAHTTGQLVEPPAFEPPIQPVKSKDRIILLVDDTEDVILLFTDYLEYSGYKVAVARNGQEAVIQAQAVNPSLILMDVQMPVMDGMEATRQIRKIPALEHTPIIALTALAMKGDRDRCLEAGMNDYLSKPVTLRTLLDLIQTHLSKPAEDKPS